MGKTTRKLKPITAGGEPKEGFLLRLQDGVEIYERETVEVCTVRKCSAKSSLEQDSGPRLVVDDSKESEEPLITKSRSDVAGLSTLLGALFHPRQRDCSSI